MHKQIADKWIAALRSGDYKQGIGVLRTSDNEFCCLGVLCNLHAQSHPGTASRQTVETMYLGEVAYLPDAAKKWAGMRSNNGESSTGERPLTWKNDRGATFNDIAEFIENNYKLL